MITNSKITTFSLVLFFLFTIVCNAQKKVIQSETEKTSIRLIQADVNLIKGTTSKVWRKCIGAGRANEGLRADWQEQLRLTKKECGFEYIRMHGLLTDDMGVYFEDKQGNPIYNWQYIDVLFDFLVDIKVRPFVEVSFMPGALASGDQTIFWWRGNVTPPKSYDKWYNFIKAMTEHYTERYGREEVKKWYFEVWNEPNLEYFFSGTRADYMKLYDYTVKAIKAVDTNYRVGGPATAGNAWIPEMINYCSENNVPIDFISTHDYAVSHGYLDEYGTQGTVLNPSYKAITQNVIDSRNKITNSKKPNLELHYTEWSTSYTPSDPVHDSYHSCAFILDKIKGTENAANSMSYWVFTDIFEEAGPRHSPFHGGFGLLNYQSVKKPAFFAYQFLNNMGNTELQNTDSASWICKNENGGIQALFWNFKLTFPSDTACNQIYYKRDLPAKEIGTTQIKLSNVPQGKYILKITNVGYKSNDAYATYMQLGSPTQLTKPQVKAIKEANMGNPINEIIEIKADKLFTCNLPMRENDVYFVELVKAY